METRVAPTAQSELQSHSAPCWRSEAIGGQLRGSKSSTIEQLVAYLLERFGLPIEHARNVLRHRLGCRFQSPGAADLLVVPAFLQSICTREWGVDRKSTRLNSST